jgi:hypothetical protein
MTDFFAHRTLFVFERLLFISAHKEWDELLINVKLRGCGMSEANAHSQLSV